MLDGEKANAHLKELIGKTCLPNLFSTHPPFQIDGNFGGAAGFAEMLIQSQNEDIVLLPAIPSSWKSGSVHGLKARGNYKFNFNWSEGKIRDLVVNSDQTANISIKFKGNSKRFELKKGENRLSFD
ncbi:glycoside hydrolase family 95-like protein [Sphingobacterium daejeonense]|uniref:glycoside hydrolase family 95-like protein n=1 Tax=Sphingobacterium daejeonense TaxID=371142 RepID=UPI0010C5B827|nr:hypothetical protein [Sphingobacterium daejeonense]VTP88938.1 Uncharacterised protein [Sphingobacterium daejeonense]